MTGFAVAVSLKRRTSPEILDSTDGASSWRWSGRRAWAVVGLFTLIDLVLCLVELTTRSMWLDEGTSWVTAGQSAGHLLGAVADQGANMAFYFVALHFFTEVFGTSVLALRLPSVIAAVAIVPLCFLIGGRLGGERVGLFASGLCSISLPLVLWAQNARAYTFGAAFSTASILFFMRALETDRRLDWGLWVVLSSLAVYSLTLASTVIVAQLLSLVLRPGSTTPWRRLLSSCAVLVVSGTWIAWVLLGLGRAPQVQWITSSATHGQASQAGAIAGFTASAQAQGSHLGAAGWILLILTAGLWTVALVPPCIDLVRRGRSEKAWRYGVVALAMIIPLVAGILAPPVVGSIVKVISNSPFLIDRYYIMCVPLGCVLAAAGLSRVRPASLSWALFASVLVLRLYVLVPSYGVSFDQFEEPSLYVLAHSQPGDCITFRIPDVATVFYYYLQHSPNAEKLVGSAPKSVLPEGPTPADADEVAKQRSYSNMPRWAVPPSQVTLDQLASCRRLWFFQTHVQASSSPSGRPNSSNLGTLTATFSSVFGRQRTLSYTDAALTLYGPR
jgi:4-amino-4-deoxy-L-arabinose transferase-like glycosyltransferase